MATAAVGLAVVGLAVVGSSGSTSAGGSSGGHWIRTWPGSVVLPHQAHGTGSASFTLTALSTGHKGAEGQGQTTRPATRCAAYGTGIRPYIRRRRQETELALTGAL
jgi:hypothetical protein